MGSSIPRFGAWHEVTVMYNVHYHCTFALPDKRAFIFQTNTNLYAFPITAVMHRKEC